MAFNDQLIHWALSDWINDQRRIRQNNGRLKSSQEIGDIELVKLIMEEISPNIYQKIDEGSQNFFSLVELYMEKEHGKKLKKQYEPLRSNTQTNSEIIGLCFFCSIQSSHKQKFIDRILNLSEPIQHTLMKEYNKIQKYFENIMEVKQILEQVEQLQSSNQFLKQKINQLLKANKLLLDSNVQIKKENLALKTEHEYQMEQKKQTFEVMKISSLQEYLDIYAKNYHQNSELEIIFVDLSNKYNYLVQQKVSLSIKVKEDCEEIHFLSEQLKKYKSLVRQSVVLKQACDEQYSVNTSQNMRSLKELQNSKHNRYSSMSFSNDKKMRKYSDWYSESTLASMNTISDKQNSMMDSDKATFNMEYFCNENDENTESLNCNKILMERLENLYTLFNQINQQFLGQQQKSQQLYKRKTKLGTKLETYKITKNDFIENYFNIDDKLTLELECVRQSREQYLENKQVYRFPKCI